MRKVTPIVTFALLTACAGMRPHDAALEMGFVVATMLDAEQTDTITRDCREANPIIGECGERMNPGLYFPIVLAAHFVATALLPNGPWRTTFQALTLGIEAKTVHGNWIDGFRIKW